MTPDAKKYLLIGSGVGALAIFAGSWLLGSRRAFADPKLPGGRRHEGGDHKRRDRDAHDENQRGEYGRKKKHRHKRHGHGG